MSHGVGVADVLSGLPDAVVVLFALLTQLGDTWFLFLVVASLYLLADDVPFAGADYGRRDAAVLLALALGAVALTIGLKALFAHSRPQTAEVVAGARVVPELLQPLYRQLVATDGYSFPSGHALGSTVVYGGLALTLDAGRRRQRWLVAGALVALVATSRLVLGVHYLPDVVTGVGVGLAYLAAVHYVAHDRPGGALMIALALALGTVLAAGFAFEPLVVLGAALGGRLAWGAVGGHVPDRPASPRESRVIGAVGLPLLVVLFALTLAVETVVVNEFAAVVVGFLAAGVSVGSLVALPIVVERHV